jgi:four helix bundle protein
LCGLHTSEQVTFRGRTSTTSKVKGQRSKVPERPARPHLLPRLCAREAIVQRFTELRVWQQGHTIVPEIYSLTGKFPPEERFGLTSQLRRAAASVPSNIAEGSKKASNADYARYLNMAEGPLAETDYLLILSRDLGYIDAATVEPMFSRVAELARMLHALRMKVDPGA